MRVIFTAGYAVRNPETSSMIKRKQRKRKRSW